MPFEISVSGNTNQTYTFLDRMLKARQYGVLDSLGRAGVEALRSRTPVDTGLTASAWTYEIERYDDFGVSITWSNTNIQGGYFNVAYHIDRGHGTGTGGWVPGRKYIDEAITPIIDEVIRVLWEEVTSA